VVTMETGKAVKGPTRRSIWPRLGRAKWDRQPTQSSAVLIATVGLPIPPAVLRRAMELSRGRPVAVISIARIYGSSMGLPNPVEGDTARDVRRRIRRRNKEIPVEGIAV